MDRDPDGAGALFSEDAGYRSNIFEEQHRGRVGVVDYWSGVTAVQGDVEVRMGAPLVEGRRADVEFWTTMTVEGNPVTLAGCLLLTFDDRGLCTDLREYWNIGEGTHQPPMGWGT